MAPLLAHELLYQVEAEYRRSHATRAAAQHKIQRELNAMPGAATDEARLIAPEHSDERRRSATSLGARVVKAARHLMRRAVVSAR